MLQFVTSSSSSLVYQESHDCDKPGKQNPQLRQVLSLHIHGQVNHSSHLSRFSSEMKPRRDTWNAIKTTFRSNKSASVTQQYREKLVSGAVVGCGLCTSAATSVFFSWLCTPVDVSHMFPPATRSQRLQTGGWLWKLSVTGYTRSTNISMQLWTCLGAMTDCVITGVVMVRFLLFFLISPF